MHLMLRGDIREAVKDGKFNVYCAEHVEDAMELLSGLPRGRLSKKGIYTRNSFNYQVQQRILKLQQQQKRLVQQATQSEDNKTAQTKS
jgi:hypothetical protein